MILSTRAQLARGIVQHVVFFSVLPFVFRVSPRATLLTANATLYHDALHLVYQSSQSKRKEKATDAPHFLSHRKPEPEFYLHACEKNNVKPSECVFLDDLGM